MNVRLACLLSTIALCMTVLPIRASTIQSITSRDAQGVNGLPAIELPLGHTVNLSFIPSGEIVRQVRLDDRSKVVLGFDSPLCSITANSGSGSGCSSGATVIYLRQLRNAIAFPRNARASYQAAGIQNTTLIVITSRSNGSNRKLYEFELRLVKQSKTNIRTIQIVADNGQASQSIRTRPSQNRNSNVDRQSIQRVRQGLEIAEAKSLIAPNSLVRDSLKKFFSLVESGRSFDDAVSSSGVPTEFIDWLMTLAL